MEPRRLPLAKKHLGQNFLTNKRILQQIVGSEDLSDTAVLEIGPGPGDLTEFILAANPSTLSVVEIDPDMIGLLEDRFGNRDIDIYLADILHLRISSSGSVSRDSGGLRISRSVSEIVLPPTYRIYGNIPYYITSPIITHCLLSLEHRPRDMVFTMQKEVADRIIAADGKHTVLSVMCHLTATIQKVCDISPNNFIPVPKVWSTCLKFTLAPESIGDVRGLMRMVKAGFAQKRKKLITNLAQGGYDRTALQKAYDVLSIDDTLRAEDLPIHLWKELFFSLMNS